MKSSLRKTLFAFLSAFFRLFPLKKRVIFSSFAGKQYSCNPKPISIALHQRYPGIKQIWVMNDPNKDMPSYVKTVKRSSLRYFYYYATSKIWVDNYVMPASFRRRKKQVYIETWHGDCSFKRFGADTAIHRDEDAANMRYQFNYALTGSTFGESYIFGKCLPFHGETLPFGCPRNDVLFHPDQETIEKTRLVLGLDKDTHLVLYAPTFRDAHSKGEAFTLPFDPEKVLKNLEESTGARWALALRLHSAEQAELGDVFQAGRIVNGNACDDMADILQITDICISDYSSCAIDFILSGRVSILYRFDLEDYATKSRELCFKDEELPFIIVHTEDELCDALRKVRSLDPKSYAEKIKSFYGIYEDGTASAKTADFIAEKLGYSKLD